MKIRKFTDTASVDSPDILGKQEPIDFLNERYSYYGNYLLDLKSRGVYLLAGWEFDFREYMTKYIVKTRTNLMEIWAPNKTAARTVVSGKVIYIIESPKQI